jgi:hypothetical protein
MLSWSHFLSGAQHWKVGFRTPRVIAFPRYSGTAIRGMKTLSFQSTCIPETAKSGKTPGRAGVPVQRSAPERDFNFLWLLSFRMTAPETCARMKNR